MKKEDFVKLGISEELAVECEKASQEELKSFIPKSRFDEVNNAKNTAEALVKERDAQIEEVKKSVGNNEELKKQIETLQAENTAKDEAHAAEVLKLKIEAAVDAELGDAKAKNKAAVKALLKDLDKAEFGDDGKIKGLSEQISALQKSDDYLFEAKETKKVKGAKLGEGADPDFKGLTKEQFSKMSYKEKVNLFNENKELYDSLSK